MSDKEVLVVYDKQCPVCHTYCNLVEIKQDAGKLKLVDARDKSAVMDEITAANLDIDQGMVVKVGDRMYYGSEAIHILSMLSSSSGLFNKFNFWLFRSKRRSYFFYPIFRSCRNLLLKALRKSKINNLGRLGNNRF